MATEKARRLARGQDADAAKPLTVEQGFARLRGRAQGQQQEPDQRCLSALSSHRCASGDSSRDARNSRAQKWRDELLAKPVPASTVNRMCMGLKAAVNLAATLDGITDRNAWTVGLKPVREPDDSTSNLVLTDDQRRDIVRSA